MPSFASLPLILSLLAPFTDEAPMRSAWLDDDVAHLHAIAGRMHFDAVNLVKLMAHESGCNPHAIDWSYQRDAGGQIVGRKANAVGLLQFDGTLPGLGYHGTPESFAQLDVAHQLPYVEKYLAPHAQYLTSLGAMYTAVFLPALLPHAFDPAYVLCGAHGPLDWAYRANKSFDVAGKGTITVADLAEVAEAFYAKTPAAQDLAARLRALDAPPDTLPAPPELDADDAPAPGFLSIPGANEPTEPGTAA